MYLLEQHIIDSYMPKMPKWGFTNFHPSHLEGYKGLDDYELSEMSINDRKQFFINQSEHGPTISASYDNHIVAIYGGVILWRGVAEAWSLFDPEVRIHKLGMCKAALAFFDMLLIAFDLHRVQITVRKDSERDVAWATYMGFEPEGLMTAYSADKEDYYMMRILR